jgi:hypothetical protein
MRIITFLVTFAALLVPAFAQKQSGTAIRYGNWLSAIENKDGKSTCSAATTTRNEYAIYITDVIIIWLEVISITIFTKTNFTSPMNIIFDIDGNIFNLTAVPGGQNPRALMVTGSNNSRSDIAAVVSGLKTAKGRARVVVAETRISEEFSLNGAREALSELAICARRERRFY